MEMTPRYLDETVADLARRGFALATSQVPIDERPELTRTRHELTREHEHLVLEACRHADGHVTYWLELREFHGLSSFSFELDSWKLHAAKHRLELKYYAQADTGLGLSLTLRLPAYTAT